MVFRDILDGRYSSAFLFILLLVYPAPTCRPASVAIVRTPRLVAEFVEPVLTPAAIKAQIVANGAIDVKVDERGHAFEASLVSWSNINTRSTDRFGLDKATVAAIRKWRFRVLSFEGQPTPFSIRIGVLLRPDGLTFTTSTPERLIHPTQH